MRFFDRYPSVALWLWGLWKIFFPLLPVYVIHGVAAFCMWLIVYVGVQILLLWLYVEAKRGEPPEFRTYHDPWVYLALGAGLEFFWWVSMIIVNNPGYTIIAFVVLMILQASLIKKYRCASEYPQYTPYWPG